MLLALALALAISIASPAHAVIIGTGAGTETETAPVGDDFGFANVGTVEVQPTPNSATYIGNRWVITAGHVGIGPVKLAGVTHQHVVGSERQYWDSPETDGVLVFRLQTDPGLPSIPLATTVPVVGESVVMAGNCALRGTTYYYRVNYYGDGYTWTGWGAGGGPQKIRWGTNVVDEVQATTFTTEFNHPDIGTAYEAQGASGDSGGPVLVKRDGVWQVAGVMLSAGGAPYWASYRDPNDGISLSYTTAAHAYPFASEINWLVSGRLYAPWKRP